MAQDLYHQPVLLDEIVALFAGQPAGVVVDATVGGGGHANAILAAAPQLRLLGIDRDPEARAHARQRLAPFTQRALVVEGTFAQLGAVVREHDAFMGTDAVVGVLMDLGVSSRQFDEGDRGFSFRSDAPLDMRMDPTTGLTAADLLTTMNQHELVRILRASGEARFANAIAKSLLETQPRTTFELTAAVERAVPPVARRRGHVATRVFQALRIAVNDEEGQLDLGLASAIDELAIGGILAVISYHSGEDRAVKAYLADQAKGGCTCPPVLECVCGATPRVEVFKASARLASSDEVAHNPRARSARLRGARKVAP
ncbi:MAG TPA: 16S rRNA (cytosine(1402)-N(4))-methyltransferase RsmH [Acidimicrobiales bacterium]|jgi:16S rRNA (cytosine1402-N4)-methyltransferase